MWLDLVFVILWILFLPLAVNVGDEGGFAPNIQDNREGESISLFC